MRLAILLLFAAGAALAQSKAPTKSSPPQPVKVAAAKAAPAVDEASAVGTLRADESVTIRPEIAGRIAEIRFAEGQNVARGALLARLDPAELAAVAASSRAQVQLEAQRVERSEDLRTKGFISQQALDDQKTSLTRARAKLAEDEARLGKSEMRAAFAGIAGLRQVSEGQYVAAGTDIARLEKIDALKLDFRVPEALVARLKPGQAAKAAVDAYPGEAFSGTIYAIEPAVDEATRTVLVRARLPNAQLKLRPGMFARVQLQLGTRESAVWVPEQAIVPKGQESFVFRVTGEGNGAKAEMVPVRLGVRKAGEVEVVKGIAAGDLVVTDGTLRIFSGSSVSVLKEESARK